MFMHYTFDMRTNEVYLFIYLLTYLLKLHSVVAKRSALWLGILKTKIDHCIIMIIIIENRPVSTTN